MKGFDLGSEPWKPLEQFGFKHRFFTLNYETVVDTWIILGLLLILLLIVNWFIKKRTGIVYHLATSFVNYFMNLSKQALGLFSFKHLAFVTTIFCFIFSSNLFAILPGIEEPTKDLNTTLALGLAAFLYTQFYAVRTSGIGSYLKSYLQPFFPMLPLNIVGKVATIISLSFRLFGNIFGGYIITKIVYGLTAGNVYGEAVVSLGPNLILVGFFGLFEGFLQAFVFAMLTLTYLSIALQGEGGH